MPKPAAVGAVGAAIILAACSTGGQATPTSEAPSPTPTPSSSESPADSPGPTQGSETAVASRCGKATAEQVKIVQRAMREEFTVTNLVDTRVDEAGTHVIVGFVEGPGLSVIAQWAGKGGDLKGLASADDFAAQVSTAPKSTSPDDLSQLLGASVECYTSTFAAAP